MGVSKEKRKQYYENWKAKKLVADPDFFKHDYQKKLVKYGNKYYNQSAAKSRKNHPENIPNWRKSHSEQYNQKLKEWEKAHTQERSEYVKKWLTQHPKVKDTQNKFKELLRKGEVIISEFCEVCPEDDIKKTTASHHPDYDYPQIIVSCCDSCHYYLNNERQAFNQKGEN